MIIKIFSQIINVFGTLFNIIGINSNNKNNTLLYFAIGNIFIAIALGLLKAYAGMTIQIIFVIQAFVNYFLEKKKIKYSIWLALIYIIVPCVILIINFDTYWDILPIIGAIIYPLVILSKEFVLRALNLISVIIWIPYNFHFGQYVGTISCIFFAITNLIAIYRFDIVKNNKK